MPSIQTSPQARSKRSSSSLPQAEATPAKVLRVGGKAMAQAPAAVQVVNPSRPDRTRQSRLVKHLLAEKTLSYQDIKNLDVFVHNVHVAPPMQLLETERQGVSARFLVDVADRMAVPYTHLAETIGIPKATAARKQAKGEMIDGAAAIALARLLALANEIVEDSTSAEARKFDTARWLGQWIERPQPALGGRKPSELLDTPTGVSMVTRLLGAIRSGAYQ